VKGEKEVKRLHPLPYISERLISHVSRLTFHFLLASLLFFYRIDFIWLFRSWTEKGYDSYGYLALFAFFLYLWKNGFVIKKGSSYLLLITGLTCVISIFIRNMGINIISALLFILSLSLLIYYYFSENIKENPSVLFLLFLMLPWTNHINLFFGYFLRRFSTIMAAVFLRFTQVEVDLHGTMLFLNQIRLDVGAPCSGSKYLFFTIFFLVIMGLFMRQKIMLLLPVSIVFALMCNIIRIVSIAHLRIFLQGEESIIFHNIIGIFYFCLTLTGVYFLCKKTSSLKLPFLFF